MPRSEIAVVAPFANERIREWSLDSYRRAVGVLRQTHRVFVVGTRAQRLRANLLVRGFDPDEVVNSCGRMQWNDVLDTIDASDMVLANNSGIAHVAASRGKWTLCIFAGSHQYQQWRPLGPRVVTVSLGTACSPCIIGDGRCSNNMACMSTLDPELVLEMFNAIRKRPLS